MGRTTEQIDGLIEEIQSFAELEHHFDRPIRTYSSGMKSRLGISVATAFKPDLLLIDEVLGVGDASFRKKIEGASETIDGRFRNRRHCFTLHGPDQFNMYPNCVIG